MADNTYRTQNGQQANGSTCNCKVGKVLKAYSLEGLDAELAERWTTNGDEQLSLRELEKFLNQRILRKSLESSSVSFVDKELELWYSILTGDDSGSNTEVPIKRRLEKQEVNVDQVVDDFVSYQTINRHLKNCLSVERVTREETDDQYVHRRIQRIYALENKLQTVINDTLTQLDNTERISLNNFDVVLNSNIICSDCGAYHTISDIVENNGCKCNSSNE